MAFGVWVFGVAHTRYAQATMGTYLLSSSLLNAITLSAYFFFLDAIMLLKIG